MAYGGFNAGSGASIYDLNLLAAGVISGHISAPLTTADGVSIATSSGDEIEAYFAPVEQKRDDSAIASAVAGVVRIIEANKQERLNEIYEITANLIRGTVVVPLFTANGEQICDRNRVALAAVRNL